MNKLAGKRAVITGGSSGIGLATAKLFVAEGAVVVVTGRRQKELDDAVRDIGGPVLGIQGTYRSWPTWIGSSRRSAPPAGSTSCSRTPAS